MRYQSLDAALDRRNLHLVSIVCLYMQLEDIWRIFLLIDHPKEKLHVAVIQFAVK